MNNTVTDEDPQLATTGELGADSAAKRERDERWRSNVVVQQWWLRLTVTAAFTLLFIQFVYQVPITPCPYNISLALVADNPSSDPGDNPDDASSYVGRAQCIDFQVRYVARNNNLKNANHGVNQRWYNILLQAIGLNKYYSFNNAYYMFSLWNLLIFVMAFAHYHINAAFLVVIQNDELIKKRLIQVRA